MIDFVKDVATNGVLIAVIAHGLIGLSLFGTKFSSAGRKPRMS